MCTAVLQALATLYFFIAWSIAKHPPVRAPSPESSISSSGLPEALNSANGSRSFIEELSARIGMHEHVKSAAKMRAGKNMERL